MVIIVDGICFSWPHSGLYRYCEELCSGLIEVMDPVEETLLILINNNIRLPGPLKQFGVSYADLERFGRDNRKPVVWHIPFQNATVYPLSHLFGEQLRVVLTVHDLNALHENVPIEQRERFLKHTGHHINAADAIVCISEFVRQDVLTHYAISGKEVTVIYNGANKLSEPHLEATSYRPVLPFILGLSHINFKKNYSSVLPLLCRHNEYELVLAGHLDDLSCVRFLKNEADRLGVGKRLSFTGNINENGKSWYLHNCSAFIHPSLAEGFGMTVVEAMSLGKPLFLSNRTCLPEIGGDVAFYFDPSCADRLCNTFSSGMDCYSKDKGLKDEIMNRAMQFSWQASIRQYMKLYRKLLP